MRAFRKDNTSRFNFSLSWKNFVLLAVGAIVQAVNLIIFLAPSNLAPGGVMGIAVIINEFTGFSWRRFFVAMVSSYKTCG